MSVFLFFFDRFYHIFLYPLVDPVRDSRTAPCRAGARPSQSLPSLPIKDQPAGPAVRGRRPSVLCLGISLSGSCLSVCLLSVCLAGWLVWLAVWSVWLSSWAILRAKRQVGSESGHPSIQIEVETGFLGAGPLKIRFKVDFGPRGTLQSPPGDKLLEIKTSGS